MDEGTFRSRLVELLKKSRQAVRGYERVERSSHDEGNRLIATQAEEWKRVNSELLRELSLALNSPSGKRLTSDILSIRERFSLVWRQSESDLLRKQTELLQAARSGEFVKSAILSSELVILKARVQATQAAHHELGDVLRKSHIAEPDEAVPVDEMPPREYPQEQRARVIPLKRQ